MTSRLSPLDAAGNTATSSNETFSTVPALFGLNVVGAESASGLGTYFPSTSDWAYIASKGINFVKLTLAWENLQDTAQLGTSDLNSTGSCN